MLPISRLLFLLPALALLSGGQLFAFLPNPDLLTVSPAVARAGETVEVRIAGTDLDGVNTLRFADTRIQVQQARKAAEEFYPEGQIIPNAFTVTIPKNVEPGVYEVRSEGFYGLSTARPFLIVEADAQEIAEAEPHESPETALKIEKNSGITGLMESRGVDWYRFVAKKGDRLLIQAWAERIDSRADAVLVLYDREMRELQSSRHHFGRDPLLDFQVPADGEYFITATDVLFRGSKDYFYRLEMSDGAHVDFAFPPAGEPGTKARITFHGRNLPGGSLGEGLTINGAPIETLDQEVPVPEEVSLVPGIFPGTPRQGMIPAFTHTIGDSNPVRIGFATAPVVREEARAALQKLDIPCEVAGRFDEPGDSDVFRIQAKKGQTWWIEVISERLGAITDPWVLVERVEKDAEGTETLSKIAENDEPPSFFGQDTFDDLNADTLDPALSFTAEEDGEYQIRLVNRSAGGSLAHLYRLAIRKAQPDFQLISGTELTKTINNDAYPMAPLLRGNGSMVYRILAPRRDGFEGRIEITAEGLPKGVLVEPLVLTGSSREGFLTLHAGPDVERWTGPIQIVGRATIGEEIVDRRARSASILWGTRVFASQRQVRSRLDEEVVLSVIPADPEPARLTVAKSDGWKATLKEKLEIPFQVEDSALRKGNIQVEVQGFPGLHRSPPKASVAEGKTEGSITLDFTPSRSFEIEPGIHQFVLQGVGNATYAQFAEGVSEAEEEASRVAAKLKSVSEELAATQKSVPGLEKAHQASEKKAAEAADDEARKPLAAEAAKALEALNNAKAEVTRLEAIVKRGEALKTAADKAVTAAKNVAKEGTSQFATYSLPVTVEVLAEEG